MWPELTVNENLQFVGELKGLEEEELEERIAELKKLLYLDPHQNKKAKNLSGGNKRKLCCAMALLS